MPTTLRSTTLPAIALEIAEALRTVESNLTPPQNRITVSYGNSNVSPRILTITATLPYTQSRVSGDAGTKFLYTDYAPDAVTLTGTPLAGQAIESLAEALGVVAEELDNGERARIAAGNTIPAGVGTDIAYANLEASITINLPYAMTINADGRPVATVTNYLA